MSLNGSEHPGYVPDGNAPGPDYTSNPGGWHHHDLGGDPGSRGVHHDPGTFFEPSAGVTRENMYVRVDYNWLSYFAKVLRDLDPYFGKGIDTMAPISFEPGTKFSAGRSLQEFVIGPDGTGGLKGQYIDNLIQVRNAVAAFAGKLEVMAKNYTRTDELQKITVADVQKMFGDVLQSVHLQPVPSQ